MDKLEPTSTLEAEARGWARAQVMPWFYRMSAENEADALRVLNPGWSYRVVKGQPDEDGAEWYIYKKAR